MPCKNNPLPLIRVLPAPAKVNLHLLVTGILPDGRHTLDTSFALIDVYDTVHVQASPDLTVRCSNPALNGENNLVYRVLDALRQHYGIRDGLDVYIEKRIPAEAGLGGGSSDAATALLAACHCWGIRVSIAQLIAFATPWGADIPCFLFGRSSRATGVGECLTPLNEPLPRGVLCLARPGGGLSTREVFRDFDRHLTLTDDHAVASVRRASQQQLPIGKNMLQASAERLLPALTVLLAGMRNKTVQTWMSGSGSSCVALCEDETTANAIAEDVQHHRLANWTITAHWLNTHPLLGWIVKVDE